MRAVRYRKCGRKSPACDQAPPNLQNRRNSPSRHRSRDPRGKVRDRLPWHCLDNSYFIELRPTARAWPAQTETKHSTIDAPMLPPARNHSPSFNKLSVCRLNEEKVVNPPQIPTITNWRVVEPTKTRPSGPVSAAKNPMMKEPTTFTMSVPHGNVAPKYLAATPEHQ